MGASSEAMKETVTEFRFVDAFQSIRPDNFTRSGLQEMFDYFEQLEEDVGEEFELDVIAICCEWSQYQSLKEYNEDHDTDFKDVDELREYTEVIEFENHSWKDGSLGGGAGFVTEGGWLIVQSY